MKPNVVIVVIDALRADRVGALSGKNITPNIDNLAAESTCFTNAYSTINATNPAITSLQTGRYPLSHGVINHGQVTQKEKSAVESVPQLPEVLLQTGYSTAVFGRGLGRWHRSGFEEYPGDYGESDEEDQKPLKHRIGSALEGIHPLLHNITATGYSMTIGQMPETNRDTQQSKSKEAVQRFKTILNDFDDSDPFYAFFHLLDTHITYNPDSDVVKECLDKFEYTPEEWTGSAPGSRDGSSEIYNRKFDRLVDKGKYPDVAEKHYSYGEPTSAVVDAHYDAAAHEADQHVGHIIEELENRDVFDDTLFILLSDHGESLTEHGIYYDHHGLYDVSIKIPLIIRPPGDEPVRETVDDFVQITDVAPTVASYADVDGLDPDGSSLKPVIEGEETIDRKFIIAEEAHTQRRRMIRTEQEKLIYLVQGDTICSYCDVQHAPEIELYDIINDPKEENNLRESKQQRVSTLRERAEVAASSYEERCAGGSTDEKIEYQDEDKVLKRLENLGYK